MTPKTALLTVGLAACAALAGCGAPGPRDVADLPSAAAATFRPDSVLTGTVARPALTTEGDAVDAHTGGATVRATVVGPEVPGEGLPYQTAATTCTWTVTLVAAGSPVPVRTTDFSVLDHLGVVYRPALVPGQPAPPAVLRPGRTATFELRAVMAVGEGLMRWAPDGRHIVASWDFEVEND